MGSTVRRRRIIALLVAAIAAWPSAIHARKPKPTPCPAAPYVVRDAPLLGSAAGPGPDRIVLDAAHVAIASGCAPQAVKRKTSRRGTTLSATWASCVGVGGQGAAEGAHRRGLPRHDGHARGEEGTAAAQAVASPPGSSSATWRAATVAQPPRRSATATSCRACRWWRRCRPTSCNRLRPRPRRCRRSRRRRSFPPATTQAQEAIFTAIHGTVTQNYVYPDFRGRDWSAIGDAYAAVIQQGLTDADFYRRDEADDRRAGRRPLPLHDAAGGGGRGGGGGGRARTSSALVSVRFRVPSTGAAIVLVTFPGSPAREAGLRPHDLLLTVDGQPVYDANGNTPLRGVENTQLAARLPATG